MVKKKLLDIWVSKLERAYREDELLDAAIIDSEGYVYGRVEKINVTEDDIVLLAYESKPDVKTVPDITHLKEELLRGVETTFGLKLRRITHAEHLTDNIRKELGLKADEQLSDAHYLKYAERLGVPIPHMKAPAKRKEQKGTVSLNEIKTIRTTVIGKAKGTETIKAILLREPKEAAFRKIPIQEKVTYRSSEVIKNKLVLDADGNALGYVDSVVLFQDTPGIRVYVSKLTGEVSLSLLISFLEESGQSKAAYLVEKHLMGEKSRRYTARKEELEDFMRQKKLSFTLPEIVMRGHSVKEFVADIPWDVVHKIGDVVLLKSTLADLRSESYLKGR